MSKYDYALPFYANQSAAKVPFVYIDICIYSPISEEHIGHHSYFFRGPSWYSLMNIRHTHTYTHRLHLYTCRRFYASNIQIVRSKWTIKNRTKKRDRERERKGRKEERRGKPSVETSSSVSTNRPFTTTKHYRLFSS